MFRSVRSRVRDHPIATTACHVFAAKCMHQPLGLISPSTIEQRPFMKCTHLLHFCLPFGLSRYMACCLEIFIPNVAGTAMQAVNPTATSARAELDMKPRRDIRLDMHCRAAIVGLHGQSPGAPNLAACLRFLNERSRARDDDGKR